MDNTKVDIVINPESIEILNNYNPVTTVVFGDDVELYKQIGFIHSLPIDKYNDDVVNEYKQKIMANPDDFYEIARADYNYQNIIKERDEVGSANKALLALLDAFNVYDYDRVADILKYNLDLLLDTAKQLERIYADIDKDNTWEIKALDYKSKYNELITKYNELIDKLNEMQASAVSRGELVLVKDKLKDSEDKCSSLITQLAEANARLSNTCSVAELDEVKEKLEQTEEHLERALSELNKKKEEKSSYFSPDEVGKDELIKTLKAQLDLASSNIRTDVNDSLPVLKDDMHLSAKRLIVFKEIKRAPYMHILTEGLRLHAISPKHISEGKRIITIIYDNLTDLNKTKYMKHQYSINVPPIEKFPVIVTDVLTQDFLRNIANIFVYNYIFIIDRLGSNKLVVSRKDAEVFYLIDSESDVADYNLDYKRCISFYDSNGQSYFDILPNPQYDSLIDKKKIYNFNQLGLIGDLLT